MRIPLLLATLLFACRIAFAQSAVSIRIKDARTRAPIAFAAIRLGAGGQGIIADLDGKATLPRTLPDGFIEITALGYESRRLTSIPDSVILLQAKNASLAEFVVKPDEAKIRRILNGAITNRDAHNPNKYDWYRCHVYYKMIADATPRDTSYIADTAKDAQEINSFLESQHLLMSETYSIRTSARPQKLQEEIIGSRLSGFKTPLFTGLVTDVLPFHACNDYLKLNGRDFRNPVSRGSGSVFRFNLRDEFLQGTDTIWLVSFFPKKGIEGLRGTVYIHSGDYAITHFTATYQDSALGSNIRVEQQYALTSGKWFPQQLNYVYGITMRSSGKKSKTGGAVIKMQGTSRIDSVSFEKDVRYHFDKLHTLKITEGAEHLSDSAWSSLRPEALDRKEARTYVFMDSLFDAVHIDRIMPYIAKLAEGKVPIGPVDLDLGRLYRYNTYEGSRYGIGLQTGDSLSRHFTIGGWGGYGAKDAAWKWGAFGEVFFDRYKESSLRIGIEHDLRDPGRIQLHCELDNNYLRNYLIYRADACDASYITLRKQFGYLQASLTLRHEDVKPKYAYTWNYEGTSATDYSTDEAILGLRYAFAERTAPLFGTYFSTGSRYPVLYAKGVQGRMMIGNTSISYQQATAAVQWTKHIARIGLERWLVEGGKSWSDAPLPIGKLFAGPGFRNDKYRISLFGGLQTAYPYDFYTDAFVSWSWRHDFDWNLYGTQLSKSISSRPGLALIYNGLWGTLNDAAVHQSVAFTVPSAGYHEGGIMLHDLLRLQYFNLYYIGFGGGYFHRLSGVNALRDDGVFVFGVNVSL